MMLLLQRRLMLMMVVLDGAPAVDPAHDCRDHRSFRWPGPASEVRLVDSNDDDGSFPLNMSIYVHTSWQSNEEEGPRSFKAPKCQLEHSHQNRGCGLCCVGRLPVILGNFSGESSSGSGRVLSSERVCCGGSIRVWKRCKHLSTHDDAHPGWWGGSFEITDVHGASLAWDAIVSIRQKASRIFANHRFVGTLALQPRFGPGIRDASAQ